MPDFILDARTASPHFPGIGRYVASLAAALAPQLGPDERLTLLTDPRQPLEPPGVRSVHVAASPFSLAQQWMIPALLRRLGATVYHSPYYLMPYRPGAPVLLTVYDLIPLRHPEHSSTRARLLFRWTTRLALTAARHVVAITETARRDFMAEFSLPADRITAIPLAADPVFRLQSGETVRAIRERYHLPERFVLYVGSNKPHKNLVGLVQAWSEAVTPAKSSGPHRFDDTALVIAGAWDERYPEARQLADSLGGLNIHWLGRIAEAELPALYASATVFVFPSLFEGFGLPVIEAMACGTPVICSNASALPEVAEGAAFLFDPATRPVETLRDGASHVETLQVDSESVETLHATSLQRALERVLGDAAMRAELRERGLARAAQFSWRDTAAATLALYRRSGHLGIG